MPTKRTTIMLPEELDKALREHSAESGIPISTLIRRAITDYLHARGHAPTPAPIRHGGKRKREC
jgi:predicted transcriptional regulator